MGAKKGITKEAYALALTKANGNIALAARTLGVERKAVQYAIEQHAGVRYAHDEAANHVTDIAEGHLVNAVMQGKWDQVRYWLETKAKDRGYGQGRIDASMNVSAEQIANMTDEELDAFIAKLHRVTRTR